MNTEKWSKIVNNKTGIHNLFIYAIVDSDNKVLAGIKKDGAMYMSNADIAGTDILIELTAI
jgi:hypothetical protein